MKRSGSCVLYSMDEALIRRVKGFLDPISEVALVQDAPALREMLSSRQPMLLLLDSRGTGIRALLRDIEECWPRTVVIVFGQERSDPLLDAENLPVYAVEDIDFDGKKMQVLVERALSFLFLSEEARLLREKLASAPQESAGTSHAATGAAARPTALPLQLCSPFLRHAGNVDSLISGIVNGMVSAGIVLRAGIFLCTRENPRYVLRASFGIREDVHVAEYDGESHLVQWLERNPQLVVRAELDRIADLSDRMMLQRALDSFGAELLVPVQGRRRLLGWLIIGRRATGRPYDTSDYQDILVFAEHFSAILENAVLYEEVTLQNTLAQTLLHSLPTGIVASGESGRVQWYNEAAERILGVSSKQVLNRPIEILGSRMADAVRRTWKDRKTYVCEWTESHTGRILEVRTAPLMNGSHCLGAVAFVQDLTLERRNKARQEELERATFWTELAAALSHEVRNPMVAIKTFAQLLPDRYAEPEFQNEFKRLVSGEVDRLNGIIEQISAFAHPPPVARGPVDLHAALAKSLDLVLGPDDRKRIHVVFDVSETLPRLCGDTNALVDGFSRIIRNSKEALVDHAHPEIVLRARAVTKQGGGAIELIMRDNGGGIMPELVSKVFSPFCTTKAQGLGLGLPIARRAVIDHNGSIEIDSSPRGTCVTILLPAMENGNGDG